MAMGVSSLRPATRPKLLDCQGQVRHPPKLASLVRALQGGSMSLHGLPVAPFHPLVVPHDDTALGQP